MSTGILTETRVSGKKKKKYVQRVIESILTSLGDTPFPPQSEDPCFETSTDAAMFSNYFFYL